MRVGIVGAGISGLACARDLSANGHEVVVFEKSRGPGGRATTRRKDGFVWDIGATSIAPRGKHIEKVLLEELPQEDLVEIKLPIFTHRNLRMEPGDSRKNVRRYTFQSGISNLGKLLAEGIDVRTEAQVDEIGKLGNRFRVASEDFDALVLTPPTPQTAALLWTIDESRPFAGVRFRSCLSIGLGFDQDLSRLPYHAVIDSEGHHPLIWLSIESNKSPGRAPVGASALVAQLSASFSIENYARTDEVLIEVVLDFLDKMLGTGFHSPVSTEVMKWKYSQPESLAMFDTVNTPGSRIVIAGDALAGGRIEDAFESGLRASNHIRALA